MEDFNKLKNILAFTFIFQMSFSLLRYYFCKMKLMIYFPKQMVQMSWAQNPTIQTRGEDMSLINTPHLFYKHKYKQYISSFLKIFVIFVFFLFFLFRTFTKGVRDSFLSS